MCTHTRTPTFIKLERKGGEKDVYLLVRPRERKTRDLGTVKCIGSEGRVLSKRVKKDGDLILTNCIVCLA